MTQESERMLSVDLMMMPMDAAVAKRENNYLPPGWSGSLAGMMNLVRVLPPAKYDQLMRDIKAKQVDLAQLQGGMSGLDHSKMGHWSEGQSARLD
jgi:hypothetical protein